MRRCAHWHRPLEGTARAVFCSVRCRKRAHRRRHAGLAEDAFRESDRRGRVQLSRLTWQEQAWEVIGAELRRPDRPLRLG